MYRIHLWGTKRGGLGVELRWGGDGPRTNQRPLGGVSLGLGKGAWARSTGWLPMARKTSRMVSESNGQRGKALVHVSEFLAVEPTKAAYWNTPRPLATFGPTDDTANGLPLHVPIKKSIYIVQIY